MKRKIIKRAAATAGLLLLLAVLMSAGTPIRLSFRDTTIVCGTTLNYSLTVDSSLTGYAVSAYQIQFTYNTTAFSFMGVNAIGCIDSAWGSPTAFEISPGTVRISGAGSSNLAGLGKLVNLQFASKVLPYDSYSNFTFQSSTFNEGIPASNNYRNGTVFMKAAPTITVSPDTWLATKGDTKQFTVSGGRSPYTWGSTVPSVATIDAAGLMKAVGAGFTRMYAADSAGIVDTTNIVEVRPIKLSFRDTSRYQGQTLDLPIYTTDLTGLGVTSGQFTVTFDHTRWTVQSVVETGTLLASVAPVSFSVGTGSVNVSFAGTTPMTGSGILLYLRMKASSVNSYGSTFAFQNVLFNQNLTANVVSGFISVQSLGTISVSPYYQQILVAGDSLQFTASGGVKPYSWSSSDPLLATVSSTGWLKGKKSGTVTVQAQDSVGAVGISGNVLIYDFRLNTPDTLLIPTSFVEIPLYITPSSMGFSAFQGTFTYSTNTYVKFSDIVSAGTLSSGFSINSSDKNGTVTFAAATGGNAVTGGGILMKLKFAVPDSTPRPSTTNITITNVKFDQGTPLALTKNGSFQIASTSVFSNSPGAVSLHAKPGQKDSALIKVYNKGTANLTSTIGVIGSSIFTVSPTNISIVPGDSAKVYVYFIPLNQGIATASIRFSTNDPFHSTVDVAATGTTPYPILVFNTLSVNFNTVTVGKFKDTTITISNTGTDTLKITAISSTTGSFTARPATGSIAPGHSMADTLRFTPSGIGFVLGRISVTSNSLTSPDTVGVSGTGNSIFPVLQFSTSNINFGSVKTGSYKDTTVIITNTGTDTLKITNVTASSAVFAGRPVTKNVSPGQSFTDTLRFTPSSLGVFTGRVFVVSNSLKITDTIIVSGTGIPSTGVKDGSTIPAEYALEQNYPNPFNPSTNIRYGLQERSSVRLAIYSILGQKIEDLVSANLEPGFYNVTWNASVPSGIYFYSLEAVPVDKSGKSFRQVRKMTLMK